VIGWDTVFQHVWTIFRLERLVEDVKLKRECVGTPLRGIGRLTWSTLGIVCLFQWSWDTIWYVLRQYGDVMASQESFWKLFRVTAGGSHTLAWIPLALIITTRLAGLPRDLRPDAREWAGRLFGSFILILYIFNDCYSLWAHGWDKIVWRH
jgi:hypothetical protein